MQTVSRKVRHKIRYALWVLNGYVGKTVSIKGPEKANILVTYYHPVRMNHADPLVRNLLRCTFVEKIVLLNHNPHVTIEDFVNVSDERLSFINQDVRRACGYRWHIAKDIDGDYFVQIDDDVLLFPQQLRTLFQHLIQDPEVPHGFSGISFLEDGGYQFREKMDVNVNYLCEIYAVSKEHVKQYLRMEEILAQDYDIPADIVQNYAGYIVISRTGYRDPKIHKLRRLLRSDSFNTPGVAIHKDKEFTGVLSDVSRAVSQIEAA